MTTEQQKPEYEFCFFNTEETGPHKTNDYSTTVVSNIVVLRNKETGVTVYPSKYRDSIRKVKSTAMVVQDDGVVADYRRMTVKIRSEDGDVNHGIKQLLLMTRTTKDDWEAVRLKGKNGSVVIPYLGSWQGNKHSSLGYQRTYDPSVFLTRDLLSQFTDEGVIESTDWEAIESDEITKINVLDVTQGVI